MEGVVAGKKKTAEEAIKDLMETGRDMDLTAIQILWELMNGGKQAKDGLTGHGRRQPEAGPPFQKRMQAESQRRGEAPEGEEGGS